MFQFEQISPRTINDKWKKEKGGDIFSLCNDMPQFKQYFKPAGLDKANTCNSKIAKQC